MNRITLIIIVFVFLCATAYSQSQKLFKIDYQIVMPSESGTNTPSGEIFLQGWVNKDHFRVSNVESSQAIYVTNKADNVAFLLLPDSEEYYITNDGQMEDEENLLPVKFIDGKQNKIAGYNCKLAHIKAGYDLDEDESSTMEIWYTEDIPNLYWGEFSIVKQIPGAVLSLTIEGNGFMASKVTTETLDNSYFEIPAGYTEMELAGDLDVNDMQVSENRFLFTDESGSLYGLLDEEDNVIIEPIYTYIAAFSGNTGVAINTEEKYGTIDADGNIILPFEYDYLAFDEDSKQYLFGQSEKYGLLDMNGKIIISAKYDMISFFKSGLATITMGEMSGLIDLNQNIVIPVAHPFILDYNKDSFTTLENEKYVLYNIAQKKRVPVDFDFVSLSSDSELILAEKEGKYGYIDKNGKTVVPFKFTYANVFANGSAAVAEDAEAFEIYYINTKGDKIEAPTE